MASEELNRAYDAFVKHVYEQVVPGIVESARAHTPVRAPWKPKYYTRFTMRVQADGSEPGWRKGDDPVLVRELYLDHPPVAGALYHHSKDYWEADVRSVSYDVHTGAWSAEVVPAVVTRDDERDRDSLADLMLKEGGWDRRRSK